MCALRAMCPLRSVAQPGGDASRPAACVCARAGEWRGTLAVKALTLALILTPNPKPLPSPPPPNPHPFVAQRAEEENVSSDSVRPVQPYNGEWTPSAGEVRAALGLTLA
eukprot:4884187-Prymnesium_polylepis.2